ncbi:oligosaccharide repeat unit polymerase [Halostagnicola kamekurae]|uniref:Oligosaccharide repeat unit polymerase n=1 Tax=Halostagnicola kamekurae TaxID=619731 RepID=A0A1I6QN76_9EURY|nr:oligosaccharide repeat unit polymerase [Halostagnicola kamekurae]SFS53889.1 oligosaccharide repeat unit polymerase [Halostagnicola kamekurae]
MDPDTAFIDLLLLVTLVAYAVVFSHSVIRDNILNPANVLAGAMIAPLVTAVGTSAGVRPETEVIWLLFTFLFLLGYTLTKHTSNVIKFHGENTHRAWFDPRIIAVFLSLGLLGFVLGAINTYEIAQSGPRGVLYNIRAGRTKQHVDLGTASYLLPFLHVGVLMMIVRGFRARQYAVFAGFWLMSVGFTLARTKLLLCLLALTTAIYYRKTILDGYRVGVKPVVSLVAIFGGGFVLMGSVLNKLDGGPLSGILFYFTIPITTFDKSIRPLGRCTDSVFDATALYPFNRILQKLGLSNTLEYQCGVPKGVAKSMLAIPYLDFGPLGLVVVPVVIGLVYGLVFAQVKRGNPYMIAFYSLFVFPLAISFYGYDFNRVIWPYYLLIFAGVYVIGGPLQAIRNQVVDSEVENEEKSVE